MVIEAVCCSSLSVDVDVPFGVLPVDAIVLWWAAARALTFLIRSPRLMEPVGVTAAAVGASGRCRSAPRRPDTCVSGAGPDRTGPDPMPRS